MTAFWFDLWCSSQTFAEAFLALFSHTTRTNASVFRTLSTVELQLSLCPRLSHVASQELLELQSLVSAVVLDENSTDLRVLRHNGKVPSSREHYLLAFSSIEDDVFAPAIWRNFSPRKCKFFLWLLHRQRLRNNARLNYCNTGPSGQCPFSTEEEAAY